MDINKITNVLIFKDGYYWLTVEIERGYIFNVNPDGTYSYDNGKYPSKFLVSAPNHFYFGIIKGETALDKFKTKYSIGE